MAVGRNIVVVGAGLIGVSTAYYLSQSAHLPEGTTITLVEATEVAAGASGSASGLIAKEVDGSPAETRDLARLSFDLHKGLAEEHDGKHRWAYRPVDALAIEVDHSKPSISSPIPWIPHLSAIASRGNAENTAQYSPRLLTKHLCSVFLAHPSASLLIGRASAIERAPNGKITGVHVDVHMEGQVQDQVLPCDQVVVAAGAWSKGSVRELLGDDATSRINVESTVVDSVVLQPSGGESVAQALSARISDGGPVERLEVQVICQPDGTVHLSRIGGMTSDLAHPPERADVDGLYASAKALSPALSRKRGAEVVEERTTRVTNTSTGFPTITALDDGVWLAAGHGEWLGCLGLGSGRLLSEMILGQPTSIDVSPFTP